MVYVYDTLQVFLANFTALDSKLFDLEFVFFCCSQPFLARYSNRSCILRHGYITIYIARILVGPCSYTHGCNFIRCHNPSVSFCMLYSFPREIALNIHFIKKYFLKHFSTHNTVFKTLTEAVREIEIRKHDPSLVLKESRSS